MRTRVKAYHDNLIEQAFVDDLTIRETANRLRQSWRESGVGNVELERDLQVAARLAEETVRGMG